jgi:hypothetical protein
MDNTKLIEKMIEARLVEEVNSPQPTVGFINPEPIPITETLPVMTPEVLDAFLNAEDEALKEDRGDVPVAEQLEQHPRSEDDGGQPSR